MYRRVRLGKRDGPCNSHFKEPGACLAAVGHPKLPPEVIELISTKKLKPSVAGPRVLADVKRIASLAFTKDEEEALRLGAATRLIDLQRSEKASRRFAALVQAVSAVGFVQIRSMATIGGDPRNGHQHGEGTTVQL